MFVALTLLRFGSDPLRCIQILDRKLRLRKPYMSGCTYHRINGTLNEAMHYLYSDNHRSAFASTMSAAKAIQGNICG